MLRHLPRADVVDIDLLVLGEVDSLIYALLELSLVKLHLQHVYLHLSLCSPHAPIVFLKTTIHQTVRLLSLLHLQELLLDLRVHQLQPECLLRRFAFQILKHTLLSQLIIINVMEELRKPQEFYEAAMLLAAVGDAMGYKNGSWEFNTSSQLIHKEMMAITQNKGPLALKIGLDWKYSDDTVMHIATAKALSLSKTTDSIEAISLKIAKEYKACSKCMAGRAPGKTCMKALSIIDESAVNWNKIPFSQLKGGGCGAAMRSACIGLFLFKDKEKLIGLSIEAGRITHHNPIGYLGSVISAYFTALALEKIAPELWVAHLFEFVFPLSRKYIQTSGREVKSNLDNGQWKKFEQSWRDYAKKRQISLSLNQKHEPYFPKEYGVIEREHFYKEISWSNWPGKLGIESVLIAYDAFLSCRGSWEEYCLRGILHGGDNDSTGTIGGAWFGAYYGFKTVPKNHYEALQDNKKLRYLGEKIYRLTK